MIVPKIQRTRLDAAKGTSGVLPELFVSEPWLGTYRAEDQSRVSQLVLTQKERLPLSGYYPSETCKKYDAS